MDLYTNRLGLGVAVQLLRQGGDLGDTLLLCVLPRLEEVFNPGPQTLSLLGVLDVDGLSSNLHQESCALLEPVLSLRYETAK